MRQSSALNYKIGEYNEPDFGREALIASQPHGADLRGEAAIPSILDAARRKLQFYSFRDYEGPVIDA